MKLTTRLKRGRKAEWWVLEGGKDRHTVAEVVHELVGGVEMMYRPYLHLLNPGPDGKPYTVRQLAARDTLADAVEVVRAALEPTVETRTKRDRTFKVVWPGGRREGLTQPEAERLVFTLTREARPWKPAG